MKRTNLAIRALFTPFFLVVVLVESLATWIAGSSPYWAAYSIKFRQRVQKFFDRKFPTQ